MIKKVFKVLMELSLIVSFQSVASAALAAIEGKLPVFPDAIEKVCSDKEGGACIESPTLRLQFSTSDNLIGVVKKLLNQSKKLGWKMNKVPGSGTPRYQSSNRKGFWLMWSVNKDSTKTDESGKSIYNIYYWKIYGE
jgi:hypothetical protein